MKAAAEGELKGILDYNTAAAGQHRLQPRPGVLHLRCDADRGGRWRAGAGDGLVRQRVGLLQPHARTPPRCSGGSETGRRCRSARSTGSTSRGKRVLLRADLNVPVRDGKITDLTRIERLSPTIRELSEKGAKVIVCSHFDRPKGKRVPEMSLRADGDGARRGAGPAGPLRRGLRRRRRPSRRWSGWRDGDVLVLENTRFHAGRGEERPGVRRASWPSSPMSTSTTPSPRRTARTPAPRAWRTCCRPMPGG